MIAYGWTEAELWKACTYTTMRTGLRYFLSNLNLLARRSHRGGSTYRFILRFNRGCPVTDAAMRKQKDGSYSHGVLVRPSQWRVTVPAVVEPMPYSELAGEPHVRPSDRTEIRYGERSVAVPCWHTFGWFFRGMFDINPEGRIKTAMADYVDRESLFDQAMRTKCHNIGSRMEPIDVGDACYCIPAGVAGWYYHPEIIGWEGHGQSR